MGKFTCLRNLILIVIFRPLKCMQRSFCGYATWFERSESQMRTRESLSFNGWHPSFLCALARHPVALLLDGQSCRCLRRGYAEPAVLLPYSLGLVLSLRFSSAYSIGQIFQQTAST